MSTPAAEPAPQQPAQQQPPALGGLGYLRLIGLGAVIGIPAALVAAGFLALVHVVETWLWTDLPNALGASEPPWYLVLGLPAVGALVVVAARRLLPGDGGHPPLGGISTAPTPWQNGAGVALAAVGTLGFGAVLGPEAPLIALGSVVGSLLTLFVRLDARGTAVLTTAGSFSAISALFGGPLVAGMLLVEGGVGLGTMLVPMLLPGLVAAAVGYVLFLGLGNWAGLEATRLTVPGLPTYVHTRVIDLVIAIGIGIVTAVVIAGIRRLGTLVQSLAAPAGRMLPVLVAVGLGVGVLALAARGLGANSQDVLFSGQSSIPGLVGESSVTVVLVLLVAKGIGYAICLGGGFRGGPVFPAIFTGVAVASVAEIWFNTSPTLAVAVGAAAGMSAMTGLVFASVLLAALLVGTPGIDTISASVLATAAAWVTSRALERPAATAPRAP
jgi:H+/Cl- antiporter ClcA